jgi:hypothetical protein
VVGAVLKGIPKPRNSPPRVFRKPSCQRVKFSASLGHLAHYKLDLGGGLGARLAIRDLSLRAFKSLQLLFNVS